MYIKVHGEAYALIKLKVYHILSDKNIFQFSNENWFMFKTFFVEDKLKLNCSSNFLYYCSHNTCAFTPPLPHLEMLFILCLENPRLGYSSDPAFVTKPVLSLLKLQLIQNILSRGWAWHRDEHAAFADFQLAAFTTNVRSCLLVILFSSSST